MNLAPARVALFATAFSIAGFGAAVAAQPAPSPTPSADAGSLREIGRVVTSDRRDEPVSKSSRPTFVVDRKRIDDLGARTVADALADVPGVDLYAYGGFGTQVNYGLRGATSEQTLILIDGQPVASPDSGAAYLQQLTTAGVDRIEVVESGSSTLYGTSASGGVINIVTRVPRGDYLAATFGSYDDRDVRAELGDGNVGATYERHVVTDAYPYPQYVYSPGLTFPAGARDNAYADQSSLRAIANVALPGGFTARARADETSLIEGVPGALDFATPGDTQGLSNGTLGVRIARSTPRSTLSLDLSGAQQKLSYADQTYGEDDTYTGRVQASLKDATYIGAADLVTGIDLARESGVFSFPSSAEYDSEGNVIGTLEPYALGAAQSQSAAYAQLGVNAGSALRVIGGLRAEHDAPQGSVLAPSFGGVLSSGRFRLTGNVGESFRVPTLDDLYYPGFSNPALLPEKAATADATLGYDTRDAAFSAGWFSRAGSNFIVLDPVTFAPTNAQRASTAGIQLTARTHPFAGFVVDLSYTDLYLALNRSTGARLPENPNGSASLGVTHAAPGDRFTYGLRWRIVGDDGDDAGHATPLSTLYDASDSVDAYVRYRLFPGAVLSLRGFNLGDEHAAPIFGYPEPGRRIFVELATR